MNVAGSLFALSQFENLKKEEELQKAVETIETYLEKSEKEKKKKKKK